MLKFTTSCLIMTAMLPFAPGCAKSYTEDEIKAVQADLEYERKIRDLDRSQRQLDAKTNEIKHQNAMKKTEMELRHSLSNEQPADEK